MQIKSFLAGGAVVAIFASIVSAEQISVPNQFAAGQPARAAEVNANFDVLVQESNAQDLRISALKGDLEKLGNVEQLFCVRDPRPGNRVFDDLGRRRFAFPIPSIRIRSNGSLASVVEQSAICIDPSDQTTVIETTPSQLAANGWSFKNEVESTSTVEIGARPDFTTNKWYLYARNRASD